MPEEETVIDLIRHGEPVGGVLIRGQRDDPLSEKGWNQMWSAVNGGPHWQHIIASPLLRCANFARDLGERLNIPVTLETRLGEIGFGEWEGVEPASLYRNCPEAIENFWANPVTHPPPGGEPFTSFQTRVNQALDTILCDYAGKHLLVVAHGGVIRVIIAQVLGMPFGNIFRMDVPYAAASRIVVERARPRLSFHCGSF